MILVRALFLAAVNLLFLGLVGAGTGLFAAEVIAGLVGLVRHDRYGDMLGAMVDAGRVTTLYGETCGFFIGILGGAEAVSRHAAAELRRAAISGPQSVQPEP